MNPNSLRLAFAPVAGLLATILLLLAPPAPPPAAAAAPARASAAACPGAHQPPTTGPRTVKAIRCLLNRERRARGLAPLRPDPRLARAARGHARDMVQRRYFGHVAPGNVTVVDRVRRARYLAGARRWTVGENLAWGTGRLATPAQIVRGWMRSPGHRANILSPSFREIGIGVARGVPVAGAAAGKRAGATFTTTFGAR